MDILLKYKKLVKQQAKESFVEGYNPTDVEGAGLLLAHYFGWDGVKILEACYNALEDANFHTENEVIYEMIKTLKEGKYFGKDKLK